MVISARRLLMSIFGQRSRFDKDMLDLFMLLASKEEGQLGLTVQNITPEIAQSLGLKRPNGVVITSVQPQSAAAEAGLRRGDVVLEVNRKEIANVDALQNAVKSAKPDSNILFLIRRGENNVFLALRSPGPQG